MKILTDILDKLNTIIKLIETLAVNSKKIFSFKEACGYLQVSESQLYKLTSQRKIRHYKPSGKLIYFNREDLNAWMQSNQVKTKEDMEKEATSYLYKNSN